MPNIFSLKIRKYKISVKNKDLWQRLDAANETHRVDWQWVKGHSGHPENERCDELARSAAESGNHLEDLGFEGK